LTFLFLRFTGKKKAEENFDSNCKSLLSSK
jgi:hypothetical protein